MHGVGDQKPFETARAIGDMLQDLATDKRDPSKKTPQCASPEPEKPRYYPFREQKLRINVNPVVMRAKEAAMPAKSLQKIARQQEKSQPEKKSATTRGPFNAWVQDQIDEEKQRQSRTKARQSDRSKTAPTDASGRKTIIQAQPEEAEQPPQFDLATEFMKGQLRCYGGDDPKDTYETVRLEGERASEDSGGPQHDVHIYELYWADLSRLKAGIFSIFTELYQLLFHLSSLGAHTVNAAVLQHLSSRRWRVFRTLQSWSVLTLTIPIPILNILMLGNAAVVVGLGILNGAGRKFPLFVGAAFVAVIGGALIAAVFGGLLWHHMRRIGWKPGFFWWISPLLLGVATTAVLLKVPYISAQIGGHLVGIETVILSVLSGVACWAILAQYNKRRPGLWPWTAILAAFVALVVVASWIWRPASDPGVGDGAWWKNIHQVLLRVFESAYGVLSLCWGVLFALVILAWIAGLLAAGLKPRDPKDAHSRWTGFLLLSLPTLIFSALTILGWALIAKGIQNYLPRVKYTPFLYGIDASSASPLADALLKIPYAWMLPLVLVAIGMAVLPAVWSLFPIVIAEVAPPTSDTALQPESSRRLGYWLSKAYTGGLLASGCILFFVSTFVLPAVAALAIVDPDALKFPGLQSLGVLSGAVFAWVFFARGSLKKLALGFRPALDLLLDVDNWLRENPLDKNPRARICGRYISLLRYIANWQSEDHPNGYDKIVIIAHSQGTVITADLLRFLNSHADNGETFIELDPQLERIRDKSLPITLFTMGCPLRQLYGRRFPFLYGWAAHEIDKPMSAFHPNDLNFGDSAKPILPGPDPERLGLSQWVNAFRSGDYVGRHLWRTDACDYLWDPYGVGASEALSKLRSTDGQFRTEFCIGAGAHTHYWDVTAPMIAEEADDLIR